VTLAVHGRKHIEGLAQEVARAAARIDQVKGL